LTFIVLLLASGALYGFSSNNVKDANASSNQNLFVSAESSQYNNYFAGPQVIQVVVSDPDIQRLDQAYSEPTVTINGKKIRMAQATDGNWYAYFADSKQAQIADSTASMAKKGLNFGEFCSASSAIAATGVDFADTIGIAIASNAPGSSNGIQNPSTNVTVTCTGSATALMEEHVVRESKVLNTNLSKAGQISTNNPAFEGAWPVIQLYDFSSIPTTVTIQYQKPSGTQSVTLTFDRIPSNLISTSLDRAQYPKDSQVFVTMNDPQLNIDPTEEDSWTWGSNVATNALYYQAFDRNGIPDAEAAPVAMQNLIGNLTSFMVNHNGKLVINPSATGSRVIDFQSNGKQTLTPSRGDPSLEITTQTSSGAQPITFTEKGGVNTGVFVNWDDESKSNIVTRDDLSIRGQSANLRYNDISQFIVGGFGFGSITISSNGPWLPNQEIPVTLVDPDVNKNSKITESLDVSDPNVSIPTLKIGNPVTLLHASNVMFYSDPSSFTAGTLIPSVGASDFSERLMIDTTSAPNGPFEKITLDLGITAGSLQNLLIAHGQHQEGINFINYDLSSFGQQLGIPSFSDTSITLHFGSLPGTSVQITDLHSLSSGKGLLLLNDHVLDAINAVPPSSSVFLEINFDESNNPNNAGKISDETSAQSIIFDIFSFGKINGQLANNAIYRLEPQETGANTGTFSDTIQYITPEAFDASLQTKLQTIGNQVTFAALQSMQQSDGTAPQIKYLDLGQDGVNTEISAEEDIVITSSHPSTQQPGAQSTQQSSTNTTTTTSTQLTTNTTITTTQENGNRQNENNQEQQNHQEQQQNHQEQQQNHQEQQQNESEQYNHGIINPTEQDMKNIDDAKTSQTIAAEVNVGNNTEETKSIDNNVQVESTENTPDSLGVKVSANNQTGPKVIAFNLAATTINVANLKDIGVMYDGKLIPPAPNMDAILHAKSTDSPSFAIVVTQSGVQVLVLIPHFSTHSITITNMSKVWTTAVPEFGSIVGIIIITSLIGTMIISQRFSRLRL